jgi:hypothetical protein
VEDRWEISCMSLGIAWPSLHYVESFYTGVHTKQSRNVESIHINSFNP